MKFDKLESRINAIWEEKTQSAIEIFVTRKALSPGFDTEWRKKGVLRQVCEEAAQFGRSFFPKGDFEVIDDEGKSPSLIFSIPATGNYARASDKTVFFYGHLDKQPEATGWSNGLGPWKPVIRDGKLYGRGCADDGYSIYAALTAIQALEREGVPHPRCTGFIETREESGSDDVKYYIEKHRARFGEPALVAVLDSSAGNYKQLWLTSTLRGALMGNLRIRVLKNGMHSGVAGGVVPSSFDIIRILLDRINDPRTGEFKLASFKAQIPEFRLEQVKATAEALKNSFLAEFHWAKNSAGESVHPMHEGAFNAMLAQTWKPSLSITGADGLPPLSQAGNTLRAETDLHLSLRLPPSVNPEHALAEISAALTQDIPFHADTEFTEACALPGWEAPEEAPWFRQACDESSLAMWGRPALRIGEGGSIPILSFFESQFQRAQFAVTGILGPGANAHAGDECLDIAYTRKFITCVASLVASVPEI
mgnify:CR=1 FL=1